MPLPAGSTPPAVPLSGPIVYDPVLSRVRLTISGLYLNANPFFDPDASNWSPSGGTFVRSTAQFHEGTAAGLLTPDGVSAEVAVGTELVPAAAGDSVRIQAWVYCAVSRTVQIGFNWYDSGSVFMSGAVTTVSVAANTWTPLAFTVTLPASVGFAQGKLVMTGTPAAGHLLYVDEAMVAGPVDVERSTDQIVWTTVRGGGAVTPVDAEISLDDYEFAADVVNYYRVGSQFSGTEIPILGGVWLKSLARPFLNREVTPRDFSPARRPSRGGVFPIVGRSDPIAVTDVRGSKRFTLDINTYSDTEAEELDLLLATGDILLVHVPTTGRLRVVPGGYVTVGDSEELVLPTVDLAHRVFSVQLTRCAAPGPDIVGATIVCAGLLNLYASCAALLAAHPTCADVLSLVGSPGDVIVA